jgi:protein-disulfide isomerase
MEAKQGKAKGKAASRSASAGAKRPFYMAVGALLVVGISTMSYMSSRPKAGSYMDSTVTPIPNSGHVIGSDSAPVEVVEFGDFECGACGSFATLTEPDVRARLVATGLVRFRYMDFPLGGHRYTWPAHMAAWCAGEQGKFWEMHDAIFQNQDRWTRPRPERVLAELAQQVGVGMEQYDACMATGKYKAQIQANADEGARRGVGSTPTFFFGSKVVPGVVPYDEFKKYVDEMLAARAAASKAPATKTKR